jgi:hypothetical protein
MSHEARMQLLTLDSEVHSDSLNHGLELDESVP